MVPTHILEIISSYVKITSSILHAYELWQEAEALARTNKGKPLSCSFSVLCIYQWKRLSWHPHV